MQNDTGLLLELSQQLQFRSLEASKRSDFTVPQEESGSQRWSWTLPPVSFSSQGKALRYPVAPWPVPVHSLRGKRMRGWWTGRGFIKEMWKLLTLFLYPSLHPPLLPRVLWLPHGHVHPHHVGNATDRL